MRKVKIPLVDLQIHHKNIKKEINEAFKKVLKSNSFILGNFVEEFEENFAKYCGAKYCIAVGNGTDALTIALKCIGIKPKDEVLVPANTFIATAEAVSLAGATPIFVDVNPDSFHIDLSKAEKKVTKKTKAIIPVHLFGQSVDMQRVTEFAKKYNLKIIQDCAQSHGAKFNGKYLVEYGDVCCYSFYPGKNLGALGDAGAIVTNNDELAKLCKMYRNHGRLNKYEHLFEGTNSRMDGIQGAILNVKLKYLDEWNSLRRKNAQIYNSLLQNISQISTPKELPLSDHVYHLYVIKTKERDQLMNFLNENQIATGIHYPIALPFLKAYQNYNFNPKDYQIAYKLQSEILSLPMYPELTESQIVYITKLIKKFFNFHS